MQPSSTSFAQTIRDLTLRRIAIFDGAGDDWRFAESLKSISEDTAQEYEGRAILELVQNGHDALSATAPGQITVVLDLTRTPGTLYVANQGRPFTKKNFRAITEFALSDKGAGEGIGNKGLGFRSVLQLTDWPEVYSRSSVQSDCFDGYCFRFASHDDIALLVNDQDLLRRVAEEVSPLALPVPAVPEDPMLEEFRLDGYSTVVRLPLRSEQAAQLARNQLDGLMSTDAPLLLFLDRIESLTTEIRTAEAERDLDPLRLGRHVRPTDLVGSGADWVDEVDLAESGTYLLARRRLDPGPLAAAVAASVANRELDEKWSKWDCTGAWVGLALRLDTPVHGGRLYTFLPMADTAVSPMPAHAQAPFFTTLARKSMSDTVQLNAHLLDQLAELALTLLRGLREHAPPPVAARLVPDLACWDPPTRLDRATASALFDEPIVPLAGGRGWGSLHDSYDWPDEARPWAEITSAALAAGGHNIVDRNAVGADRRARLAKLRKELLGTLMRPSADTIARWAEQIADRLPGPDHPGASARWAGFYDDLRQLFATDAAPLRGAQVIVDQSGVVRRALGVEPGDRDDTLFFSPEAAGDNTAGRIPSDLQALRRRIAFTHPAVPWSKPARAFFEAGALVREYRADRVFDALRDLLGTSRSDALRRDALRFVYRQWPALNAAQRVSLRGICLFVPRADGAWARADESLMSPGWGAEGARRLQRLLAAAGDSAAALGSLTARWIAGPDGWPGEVGDQSAYAQFLAAIGVRDGLLLPGLGPVSERQGNQISAQGIARQQGLAPQVANGWAADVAEIWHGGNHPYTRYRFSGPLTTLPGAGDAESLNPAARREFAELIAHSLASWPDGAFTVILRRPGRPHGQQDPHRWPTPLASALRHLPWLPVVADDAGGLEYRPPRRVWYSPDGDLPPFVPSMPLGLRRLLAESQALSRIAAFGLRRWDDPVYAAEAAEDLARALADGAVPEHLAATFRKHYARALADASARGWPGDSDDVVLAVVRDGRLEAVRARADLVTYVPDQHAPLKESLVELAGHPVLIADPDAGAAIAAALAARGLPAARLSEVDVRVFSGEEEVLPEAGRPLLVDGREWLVTVVALVLELKSGTFVRRAERTLRALLTQVRSVRLARLPDVTVRVGMSSSVPPGSIRSVPMPDADHPTIAVWDADGEWDELQACVPALAHLLAQPYLHDALQLALIKLERLQDTSAALDDDTLARVLDTTPARVRELRRSLEGDLDGLKRVARTVVAALVAPQDRDAADDAVRACVSEQALATLLAAHRDTLGVDPAQALALMRTAGSLDEVRDGLCIGFGDFNAALAALGPPYVPITHPELHDVALARFLADNGPRMLERLRERYRPLAERGQKVGEYARARRFDGLVPDPSWLMTCRTPDEDQLGEAARAWLAEHGARTDLAAPAELPPVEHMRTRAFERLDALVARAAPLVLAWCRKREIEPPPAWSGAAPRLEAAFALEETGIADLVDPPDQRLLEAAAAGAEWPPGMRLSVDLDELGITDEDLTTSGSTAPGTRTVKPPRTIRLGTEELLVGTDHLTAIAEAAMTTVNQAFLAQHGRTDLAELPPPPGGGKTVGGRGTIVARDRSLTEDERVAIGLVGEVAARAWLARKYRDVRWMSGYAALVSSAPDAHDGWGYDFEVGWRKTTLMFEVKSMRAEPGALAEIEMGDSEVRAAQAAARGERYRLLLVTSVLDADRRIHVLPNPFSAKGQGRFRVTGRGLRYQFAPR